MHMPLAATLIPAPAPAALAQQTIKPQWLCQFATRCRDADCTVSDHRVTVYLPAPPTDERPLSATIADPTSIVTRQGPRHTDASHLIGGWHTSYCPLSATPDGAAIHNDDQAGSLTHFSTYSEAA
ncbi:MAG: hypothetical protein Q4G22_06715 [Paracoccus sp. (in: a-proteobacteria)]|uniref:hypothetical protein n=1 Tax=Paracoccus sp. TaxID=267 RepID=UPI0026DF8B80|nr:hypothetical protein [Paracoccus sp. (in: a-proteobacteria)]MDO5631513.1 hypothetical protein [Paracoccus sp. (in: a-proteobacteria)]